MIICFLLNECLYKCSQMKKFLICIKLNLWFVKEYLILIITINSKSFRPTVISLFLSKKYRKNIFLISKILFRRSPHWYFSFVFSNLMFLFCINPWVEHSFKPHISCQSCISLWDPKRVKLPTNSWSFCSKLLGYESMPHHEVVNNIITGCTCLIWSTPTTVDKGQLSFLD